MERQASWHRAALGVAIPLLIGAAAFLQGVRERQYVPPPIREESLYIRSGTALRRLTLGFNVLAADLYWIRTIQYYGGTKLRLMQTGANQPGREDDYALLYPLLDLTTTLDPRFNIAYRFGAIFVAEPFPGGAGRPDLAIALLEKGLRERPDKWEYMQDIGFVHYWWRHDYQAAAEWFRRAAAVPGAPWFLRSLAATTLAEGGDRQSSRTMWESIRASAETEWLRREAERRLMQLRAMDEIDALQQRLESAASRLGATPRHWDQVLNGRVVPLDPTGTPYELLDGRVRLSKSSPLFPLPEEPKHRLGPVL